MIRARQPDRDRVRPPVVRTRTSSPLRRALGQTAAVLIHPLLAACGEYGGSSSGGGGGNGGSSSSSTFSGATSGASLSERVTAFEQTAYPLLTQYCSECHAGAGPGTPHVSHPDLATAYGAVVDNSKVNLGTPPSSRLVRRLVTDFHYCWSDCASDGAEMEAAIAQWAQLISFGGGGTSVDGIVSADLTFADGVEEEGEDRYARNLIALYEFKDGAGNVAHDTSGVAPPLDLTLEGPEFMSNYGIRIEEGRASATAQASRKLYDRIADPNWGSQQYSVEAWIVPDNTDQEGPARIISYSDGTSRRNFTLGQVLYYYNFRNRSLDPEADANGRPALQTADADEDLQATLQHVVVTYDRYRGRRVYVDAVFTEDLDTVAPSRLWNWDPGYTFLMGNETSNNRPWVGQIRLVAIYGHALSEAQIQQNYDAGVGKRLLFQFDLTPWLGAGSYVEFVVEEFDEFSYLFCEPRLVTGGATGFRVANLRIAVNGLVPAPGQAFQTVDVLLDQPSQILSRQCSVIPKDQGPAGDVFSLEFEYLGDFENPIVLPPPPPPPPVAFGDPLPDEGLRSFERLHATMAAVTGVDPSTPAVRDAFLELTQQLPATFDLRTFASAQQVAISKLALEYCDLLVETASLRDAFFGTTPAFAFDAAVPTAFAGATERAIVLDGLVNRIYGENLATQPALSETRPELDGLVDQLIAGCDAITCGPERTRTVVKAACAAVLASASVTIH